LNGAGLTCGNHFQRTGLLAHGPKVLVEPVENLAQLQLAIDASGISFQPVLGAIGTTLSTFVPPVIPPP